jgi:hypothetical protein
MKEHNKYMRQSISLPKFTFTKGTYVFIEELIKSQVPNSPLSLSVNYQGGLSYYLRSLLFDAR